MGGLAYKKGGLMSYEFKKLGRIEKIDELPADATVLVETNYQVKRVPSSAIALGITIVKRSDLLDDEYGVGIIPDELMDSVKKNLSSVFVEETDRRNNKVYRRALGFEIYPETGDLFLRVEWNLDGIDPIDYIIAQSSVEAFLEAHPAE